MLELQQPDKLRVTVSGTGNAMLMVAKSDVPVR
jgi:hypothetical protein